MNRFFLLFALVAACAVSAAAGNVTFNTTGSTLCLTSAGCAAGTLSQNLGTITVSYNSTPDNTVNAPSSANFGALQVTCNGGGTGCGVNNLPAGGLFLFININQTAPPAGSNGIPAGTLVGQIAGNGSSASINWLSGTSTVVGGNLYSVVNLPLNLVPPTTNNGVTTIQGFVNTPEPASILLLSSGLGALMLARRRGSRN